MNAMGDEHRVNDERALTPDFDHAPVHEVTGTARVGSDPFDVARRVRPGDIAIIDATDLTRSAAAALVEARPGAIVNAAPTSTGRLPTRGGTAFADAGIPLVDRAGQAVLATRDGRSVTVHDAEIVQDDTIVATGVVISPEALEALEADARKGLHVRAASLASNSLARIEADAPALIDGVGLPDTGIPFKGAAVVIVGDGPDRDAELRALRRYLRERKPIIVATGSAADAVAKAVRAPDLIVGLLDDVADATLGHARAVVLHRGTSAAPGATRLQTLGIVHGEYSSLLTDVDLATLIAFHGGASAIVTVGAAPSLRSLVESTEEAAVGAFLVRLVASERVVDAPVALNLYRHRYRAWVVWAVFLTALATLTVAIAVSPDARAVVLDVWDTVLGWFGGDS